MSNPFVFKRTIIVKQREHSKITSNDDVLNYLIDKTIYMKMYMKKVGDDELHLSPLASKLIVVNKSIRSQDVLGNLELKVKLNNEHIAVDVTTKNNALFLFAFILYIGAFILYLKSASKNNLENLNYQFLGITVFYILYLTIRWITFLDVKARLEYQLFKIN